MEKFFKPVHSPSAPDEIKLRKHHHHHHPHHQDLQSHRYTMFDDSDRTTDESHGHHRHHQHGHYLHDNPHSDTHYRHQTHQFHPNDEDEILYNHGTPVTLSRASSSSLSSSSSSHSSSSWYTEASANDPFSLRHAERPQHSLSCSNIPDVRKGFREDDTSGPVVFATIKHGSNGSVCSQPNGSAEQRGKQAFSSLDRGQSRSEEALQGNEGDDRREKSRVPNYGPLYKTSSLNRSLAFSEEDILLGVSRGPKRAVSSIQLPSKGILKNREPHADIRKAKSMEVLSPRVAKGQNPIGPKGKVINPADIERARESFVQGKLQFSAFLDEITKQVMSPSYLTILGVNKDKTTGNTCTSAQTPGPVKPQLPPKKHRESSGEARVQHAKPQSRQEKTARSSSRKQSESSNSDKLISYGARKHQGSPPPHPYPNSPSHNTHHGRSHKDKRLSPLGGSVSGDWYGMSGSHLTDGTSTSPEPSQPKQRHHRKKQTTAFGSPHPHNQHFPQPQLEEVHPRPGKRGPSISPTSSAQGAGLGLGSESSSGKSDSSRARDTPSTTTCHISQQSGRHHSQHFGNSKQRRDTLLDVEHLQALQEENTDLHQNLLQTVVCIESLESELQRTREELSAVKEKYKSLLETHTGTKQANSLLGEHLHIASESLSNERKYLLNRVSQLSSELEDAHRTISALENFNVSAMPSTGGPGTRRHKQERQVPCLIKDLLEKRFDSDEAVQMFMTASTPISYPATPPQADNRPHYPKVVDEAHDWLTKSEAAPQMVTAFVPFKQGVTEGCVSGQHESSHSPPFSVADIGTAIYNKIAANYAARPQPLYFHSQQQPTLTTHFTDTHPNPKQASGGDRVCGKGEGELNVTLLEEDIVDVTSLSAQRILDDFMQQLQAHKEVGGGKEQPGGQPWTGGAEQTGKVAD